MLQHFIFHVSVTVGAFGRGHMSKLAVAGYVVLLSPEQTENILLLMSKASFRRGCNHNVYLFSVAVSKCDII